MNTRQIAWAALLLSLSLGLTGCGMLHPSKADGPPREHRDVSRIPNAVPKIERLSKYGNPKTYKVFGKQYHTLRSAQNYHARGIASWYGRKFAGKRTSSGEIYDPYGMTAAHKTLPLPTYVRVTNLQNGRKVIVKVNDRGPFHTRRILDLSYAAAKKLGVLAKGTAPVRVDAINLRAPTLAPVWSGRASSYWQVAALSSADNAKTFAARLQSQLAQPLRQQVQVQQTAALYKIRLGPLHTHAQAQQALQALQALGYRPIPSGR